MRRHMAKAGAWLAGASGVSLFGYVPVAAKGGYPIWPYFVFGGLMVGGLALYILGERGPSTTSPTDSAESGAKGASSGEVFTAVWRHTTNGVEVVPLMSLTNV